MRVWDMDFNVPISVNGDSFLGLMLTKSIKEHGLIGAWFNGQIGAPEMSSLIDVPFLDNVNILEVWLLTKIFSSEAKISYITYMLSYPLAAITMYILLRYLNINRITNILLSILYSIVPYHFLRGMNHGTLSNYYILPIGVLLALMIIQEEYKGSIPKKYSQYKWRKIVFYLSFILIGFSNIYYSFFSMLLILLAVLFKLIKQKNCKPLFNEIRVFLYTALFFIIHLLPKILYGVINGQNEIASIRHFSGSEVYGLKFIQMILPPSYSRVEWLRKIAESYNKDKRLIVNENATATLGLFATIGLIIALVWFVIHYVKKENDTFQEKNYLDFISLAVIFLILWSMIGGFGTIFAYVITPQLRALNRISILISALCFVMIALVLKILFKKISKKIYYAALTILFCIAVFLDTNIKNAHWQDGLKQADAMYKAFFTDVEAAMEDGDLIYQLPMSAFPESPAVNNMLDYSLLRGYVYTEKNLKWSYGGVKGRDTKAMELYIDNGMSFHFLEDIMDAGFEGIYIDTDGFKDGGTAINNFYQNELGLQPIVSGDKKLYFYSLKDFTIDCSYIFNTDILFSTEKRDADKYVRKGLSGNETKFSWTNGNELQMKLKIDEIYYGKSAHASFEVYRVYNEKQTVEVTVNDKVVYSNILQNGQNLDFDFTIPDSNEIIIRISLPDAVSPLELGQSTDSRKLALALVKAKLELLE